MSDRPTLNVEDLPPDVRKRLREQGVKVTRPRSRRGLNMHGVRSFAIRVLEVMADQTQSDRARVLRHALKVNDV